MHIDTRLSNVGVQGHDVRFSSYFTEDRIWIQGFTIEEGYISQQNEYFDDYYVQLFIVGEESGDFICSF